MHFLLGITELLECSIALRYTSIQFLLVLVRTKWISLLTGVRLVPAFRVHYLLVQDIRALGAAIDIVLLLFTVSAVMISFIERNHMDQITVSISLIRIISLLLPGDGLLGFTNCAPRAIPGFQGPNQINPLFRKYDIVVLINFIFKIFLYYFRKVVFKFLAYNLLLLRHRYFIITQNYPTPYSMVCLYLIGI